MDDVLKESGEARKHAVSLRHVEYSGALVEQMFNHSNDMEKLYGTMQILMAGDIKDSKCHKIITMVEAKKAWFEKAKAGQPTSSQPTSIITLVNLYT